MNPGEPLIKYPESRFDEIGPYARREGRVDIPYLNRSSQRRRWANIVKTLRALVWRAVCGVALLVKGAPFTSSRVLQPIPPNQRATRILDQRFPSLTSFSMPAAA